MAPLRWSHVGFLWFSCGTTVCMLNEHGFNDPAIGGIGGVAMLVGAVLLIGSVFEEE